MEGKPLFKGFSGLTGGIDRDKSGAGLGKSLGLFGNKDISANPFNIGGVGNSGNLFNFKPEKKVEQKKTEDKSPFAMPSNASLFSAPFSGIKSNIEEDKKLLPPPKTSSPSVLNEALNAPEAETEDQIKLMTFEEFKTAGMNGKTMSEIFNKWRSKLIETANEMKGTEKELQNYEGQLLDLLKKTFIQIQTVDLANEITQQQKSTLIKLKRDQVFFICKIIGRVK